MNAHLPTLKYQSQSSERTLIRWGTALLVSVLLLGNRTDAQAQTINGTVFEDVNYGGGSGRTLAASGGIAGPGATVELYDANNNYVRSTVTNASGVYTFAVAAGSYTVRVVNSTVTSSRTGGLPGTGLLPVQTYNGTITRVGGEAPAKADAGPITPTANGNARLRFEGDASGSDRTAYVDQVEILDAGGNVVSGAVANPSFETPSLGATNAAPNNAGWLFPFRSGITTVTNPGYVTTTAPDGSQVAFIQTVNTGNQGVIQQDVPLPAGTYTVRFWGGQRSTTLQTLRVLVNGTPVAIVTPPAPSGSPTVTNYTRYTTSSFTITGNSYLGLTTATAAAQSIQPVTVPATGTITADFGYNFDTVVNTNDSGQGSLRQFIVNASALGGEGSLAQSGSRVTTAGTNAALPAGQETSIFMIPSGAARNGLLASTTSNGPASQLTNDVAIINTTSTLALTGANATNTIIDGGTQTFNIGNTANAVVTGSVTANTAVGVGTGFNVTARNVPEVEISGSSLATVLDVEATTTTLRGFATHGGTTQAVLLGGTASATGYLIDNAVVGVTATGALPGASTTTTSNGIYLAGNAGAGVVQSSLIAYTGGAGINVETGVSTAGTTQLLLNQLLQNGYTSASGDAITLGEVAATGSGPALVQGNLITNPNAFGVGFEIGSTASAQVLNNTITGAGTGGAASSTSLLEGAGIGYLQRDSSKRSLSTQTDLLSKNLITGAQAAGIVVGYGQQNVTISQNSISDNGGLAVDLITKADYYATSTNPTGAANYGNGDGVTLNDGNNPATAAATLPNRGVDFPVITSAVINGNTLTLTGYCRPGAVVELFSTDATPDGTGFGEGKTYLGTFTEGVNDADATTDAYNLAQGSDAAASRFSVSVTSTFLASLPTGSRLTGTATLNASTSELGGNFTVQSIPVPAYVTTTGIPTINGQTIISPLTATDQDGTIVSYTILSLPASSSPTSAAGTLYYNSNADGTSGTYQPVTVPLTLTPAQAGTLRFAPSGTIAGNLTFRYTATDNSGNVSTTAQNGANNIAGPAVYTIPVTGVVANNDSNAVPLNTATAGNVLLNDTGSTGITVTLSASVTASGTTTVFSNGTAATPHGTVAIATNGAYTYTPAAGYLGNDVFAYQVCNTAAPDACATALVNLRVYDPGSACTSGIGTNLLVNPDFNQGSTGFVSDYTLVAKPDPLIMNQNGLYPTFTYAVDANATDYHFAFFGRGHSSATNPNDKFMMVNGAASIARIYSQTVPVLPNRYYTFSAFFNNLLDPTRNVAKPEVGFIINGESTSGTRVIGESPDRWVQASDIWFSGSNTSATFEIRNVSTLASGNDFAIDDVYFGTCNLAPVANNDLFTTPLNTNITFSATANDTDLDGAIVPSTLDLDPGTAGQQTTFAVANQGSFMVDGSGNVTFMPVSGFRGAASIPYTIQDNNTPTAALSNIGTLSITVGPPPLDLTTTITASANPVAATAPETLTITAINNGPSGTAVSVTQTVQLPAGLTGITFGTPTVGAGATLASGSPSYNGTTGLVTFPGIASQVAGATGNVVYSVSFNTPANAAFTATANIASTSNSDTNPANNSASVTIGVNPRHDLVTTLSGPTTAVQGTLITYMVSSANSGPSIALDAVQTVTGLPTGLTQVFVSNGGTYDSGNGTVTFPTIASFPSGQAVANTISFTAPASGTTITPVAALTSGTGSGTETNTANNTAGLNGMGGSTTTTGLTATAANLRVSALTTSASIVAPGTTTTVSVSYVNDGPGAAASVVYQLSLQPGFSTATLRVGGQTGALSGTTISFANGASYDTTTGIITFNSSPATVSSAGSQSYSLTFTAPSAGMVLVAASVRGTTSDPVPADNFASTKVNIEPSADVATAIFGPASAVAGQLVSYTVATTNNGGATALSVAQIVELPGGLPAATLLLNGATGTFSAGLITFTGGAAYNIASGLLTLPTVTGIPAGSSSNSTISFVAPATLASFTATALVSSTSPDGVPSNNSSTTTTTVMPSVDVRTLLSAPASVPIYSPLTYSITTINDGPAVASSVIPTLQLPANLPNMLLPTDASYNSASGLVTFPAISNLASGAAVTSSVSFTMPAGAQITGLGASTVSGIADRNVDNNRVSLTTSSATPTDLIADLSATVTSAATSVNAGAPVTFTVTISNGPSSTSDTAPSVRPVLALPAGLDVTTIQVGGQVGTYNTGSALVTFPSGATYSFATGLVSFPVTAELVASDGSGYAPLSDTVTVTAPSLDLLTATASVSSGISDPTPSNNQQTVNVTINAQADLVTSISGPAAAPAAGGTVIYAVTTTNQGGSPALSATTTVSLPAMATNIVAPTGSVVSGTTVTLPAVAYQQPGPNGAATQTISFTAAGGTPGTGFVVTATASTTTTETSTANNGSTISTTRANQSPVAQNVVNRLQTPEGNTATAQLPISPLAATDVDGSVATYQLTGSLPSTAQGVLYYNNSADGTTGSYIALPTGQNLTQAQANNLRFDPADNYAGNVTFTYTATDNLGAMSSPALYTIPVGNDNSSAYTATPTKGGANQYQTNDVLAFVIDPNGAAYNSSSLVYNASGTRSTILATNGKNGLASSPTAAVRAPAGNGPAASGPYPANPTNVLPAGVSLDPATGLIYVSDRSLLVNNTTAQYYQINVITTDIYGGTNVVPARFTIGALPLPVELTAFTATAVKNIDAQLAWRTASEKANDHFDVERSLNGTDYVKIKQVEGQGTSSSPTDYALTDAGIGTKVTGTVYYRLKQVDTDGAASYSPVRTVAFTNTAATMLTPAISLYPNPTVGGATQLNLTELPAGTYQVSVLDATGRVVLGTALEAGLLHALDLNTIASGTYTVLVRGHNGGQVVSLTKRLIKE